MKEFVIGSMYWVNPKATLDELRADMREVRDNGLTLLRTFLCWEYIEEKKGVFDFSFYDRFFKAAEEYDIKLMPTIVFYPPFYLIRDWLKAGIDDRKRRVPCIDHPEVQAALGKFIAETVQHYCKSPALKMWNIWNEPTDSICYCKDSIKEFVKFLHKKYKTMEELRESWAGEYYIFNPILPESLEALDEQFIQDELDCASRDRNTGIRLDWREFNMYHSAAYAAWIVHEIHKYDTVHECHSNPAQRGNPMDGGVNAFLFAKELDSVSGSVHPHSFCNDLKVGVNHYEILPMLSYIDRFRSWGQGKDAYIGEYQGGSTYRTLNAYTPRGKDHFATLFHAMARGLKGVVFWEWQSWRQSYFEVGEFSLRNPSDGGPTERSAAVKHFAEIYLEHHDFFSAAQMKQAEVAIFSSMEQNCMDAEGPMWDHAHAQVKHSHTLSALLCHRALASAGIKADFVTECLFPDNVLSHYKVLIIPNVRLVSPETAEALKEFVRNGGAIWTDGRLGFLDTHTFLRRCVPCNGLDQLFGCREIDEVAPYPGDVLKTAYGDIPPFRMLPRLEAAAGAEVIAECNGYPAAVRYGKNEYWGAPLCWGDLRNGTSYADPVIIDFVRRNGVQPELEFTGKRCLVSCIHTDRQKAVAVTNDSQETQIFRVKKADFPAPHEEWTRDAQPMEENDVFVWPIPAGETYCIVSKKQ